jgi:hypothetical protein
LKAVPAFLAVVVVSILAGCQPAARKEQARDKEKILLTVDFKEGQTLQYKFVSSREIELDWDPAKTASKSGSSTVNKFTEKMEMVVAYTPTKVDPYGLTTVRATCKSVKAARTKTGARRAGQKDAVESFAGKTFTFTVGPTGRIEDCSQLDELIEKIGEKAFRPNTEKGRIKDPDMIADFVASQWFLWDSVASIEKPTEGVAVGQTWKSKLSVPTPMVMRQARDVTYRLSEIRPSDKGRLAMIQSSYKLAESVPTTWPIPYSGRFQMSGTFGFLRGYKMLALEGQGEELFNIDMGRIQRYNQRYKMQLSAALPMGIAANPTITIDQNLTMELLE